jgi:SAM-dependent methyltransferase
LGNSSQEVIQLNNTEQKLKQQTAKNFGFEWSKFSNVFDEYEDNFLSYIEPVNKEFFSGKTVLDAGCGAGRHAYFAAKWGAKAVVGFDIGKGAVEAAKRNTKELINTNIVQADIYNLPWFWYDKFNIVMAIGVLQHLPDPQAGFDALVKMVKPGGTILIWVYGRRDNWMAIHLYETVRRITTRIPNKILYWGALAAAIGVEVANRCRIPLWQYYRKLPFKTKWNDAFDVLSAPKSRYYTQWDIQKWFKGAGMKAENTKVEYRILGGRAKGIKGMGTR